jgi:type IV secretory pathway VirB4 component
MTNLRRALRAYKDSGSLNELLGPTAAVADDVFITKSGDLGMALSVTGIEFECASDEWLETQSKRFEAAVRPFGDEYRTYQYVLKYEGVDIPTSEYEDEAVAECQQRRRDHVLNKPGKLFTTEIYFVFLYEARSFLATPVDSLRARAELLLSQKRQLTVRRTQLERDILALRHRVESFVTSTADLIGATVLDKSGTFQFLRRLFNLAAGRAEAVTLRHDDHIDYYAADSSIEVDDNDKGLLRMDGVPVHVWVMKEEPKATWVNLFRNLHRIESNLIICTEFRPVPNAVMLQKIKRKILAYDYARFGFIAEAAKKLLSEKESERDRDIREDDSAVEQIKRLKTARKDMQTTGAYFGEFAMTVVLYGGTETTLHRAGSDLMRIVGEMDGAMVRDTYTAQYSYAAICPGSTALQQRKQYLMSRNYVDMSLPYTIGGGERTNKYIDREYLSVYEHSNNGLYFHNLHSEGGALGELILGAPGSGKSVTANGQIADSQKYGGYTLINDIGGSYKGICALFGGAYKTLRMDDTEDTWNPFCLPNTRDNMDFLASFIAVLMETAGRRVSGNELAEVFDTVRRMYSIEPNHRTLTACWRMLPPGLKDGLRPWVRGGQYGQMFDNVRDTLTLSRFQCFDFSGLRDQAHIAEPTMFYIQHRFSQVVTDPDNLLSLKIMWTDEAHLILQNRIFVDYFLAAGKTWRKHNGGIVVITQSAHDLERAGLLDVVRQVCPITMFHADAGCDREQLAKWFDLNPREVQIHAELRPQGDILLKTPTYSKLLKHDLDRVSLALYGTTPRQMARREQVFREHGAARGLEILTGREDSRAIARTA